MSVEDMRVTIINCDGHDDDPIGVPFENKWGDTYFEDEAIAINDARAEGWEIEEGSRYGAAAYCPDCVTKRKRAEAGLSEIPEEIPGQLDIFEAVAHA